VYVLNHADRNVFVIVAPLVQKEFALSDFHLGLLTGTAFAVFYSVVGVPMGYLADRTSRRGILVGTLVGWSALTALMGAATSGLQIALLRVAVGIGESGCAPASHSLLGQHLQGARRAFALAVFGLGPPVGMALAFAAGSVVAEHYGWRAAFVALGLIGLPVAWAAWKVITPALDRREAAAQHRAADHSLVAQVRHLLATPTYLWLFIANGMLFTAFAATVQWAPVFLTRVHEMPLASIGLSLAVAAGLSSIFGNLAGGWYVIRRRLDRADALLKVSLFAAATSVPSLIAAYLAPSPFTALALLALATALVAVSTGPNYGAAQEVVAPGHRAVAAGLLLLIANLIGLGIGTPLIGAVSDALAPTLGAGRGLQVAAITFSAVAGLCSVTAYTVAIRHAVRSRTHGRLVSSQMGGEGS
jgi:predicted MFS family arabinose efflux permease